jgi:hypothetical protein
MSKINSWNARMLVIPGCFEALPKCLSEISDKVHWRFCGGFFIGDGVSILNWLKHYQRYVAEFMHTYNLITWDFNIWGWIEKHQTQDDTQITWYNANHNETIIFVKPDVLCNKITQICSQKTLTNLLPVIRDFYATSGTYIEHNGRHWLNTRYVSYKILSDGVYFFSNGNKVIENKNVLSELMFDNETGLLVPISDTYQIVTEENLSILQKNHGISRGLEDIRLYHGVNNVIKYVATTSGYSPNGKCRIIVGEYSIEDGKIMNGQIVQPPTDTWCEKNWVPLVHEEEELYIYKWWPCIQYGKIGENNTLEIIKKSSNLKDPIFINVRGSTTFIKENDLLTGIVHMSEEFKPRHYYHMFVQLNATTLELVNYSCPFRFGENHGIEFCIGFRETFDKYHYMFWVSFHDRDPKVLMAKKAAISWIL